MEPITPGTASGTLTGSKTVYNNDPALMSRVADLEDLVRKFINNTKPGTQNPASATPTPTPMEVAVPAPIVTSHIESPVHRNLSPTFDVVVEETGEALSSDLNPQSGENGKSQGQSSIGGSPNKEPETCSQSGKRGLHVAVLEVIGNEGARPQRKRRAKEVEKLGAAPRKSPRRQAVEVEDSEEVVATKTSARVSLDAGCSIPKALCDPF